MPRRNRPSKRESLPDVRYNSVMVSQLINRLMYWGKKSLAERIVYGSFDIIESRLNREPLAVFEQAIRNLTPLLEVKPRRVGGATYQVPVEVTEDRGRSLALRWLLQAARNRPGRGMATKLADEVMDAYQNAGASIKKREDTHRMAEANKAFAHYRW